MRRLQLTIVTGILLLLVGCATTPTPMSESKEAPPDRVLAFQTRPAADAATLIVIRDSGLLGGGCYSALSIDGTLDARLDPSERARFFLLPGEHVLSHGRDPQGQGLCGMQVVPPTMRETTFRPNETKYFRLTIEPGGHIDVQRTDP